MFLCHIFRKSSPKLQKRLSCPNAYGTLDGSTIQTSTYSDVIPAQQIPPQPVQPELNENPPSTVSTSLPSFKVQTTTYHRLEFSSIFFTVQQNFSLLWNLMEGQCP